MEPFRVRMNEDTFWFGPYSKSDEYIDDIYDVLKEDLDEPSLIEALCEKWNLHDEAHNHRTLRQRLEKAIEIGRVRRYAVGPVTVYTVAREEAI